MGLPAAGTFGLAVLSAAVRLLLSGWYVFAFAG